MPELPDGPDKPGDGGGSQISQEALDALLSATSDAPEIDDGGALGDLLGGDADESDLDFGLGNADAAGDKSADGLDMHSLPGSGESEPMFGGFDLGNGNIDLPAFEVAAGGGYPSDTNDEGFLRVRDIPLDIVVELGRTRLLIKDVLDLSTGAIIELDKIAGEPVDLFANGLLVARGEVIVIDDNFGVRLTEIITAEERLKAQHSHSIAA